MELHRIDFASLPWEETAPGARSKFCVRGQQKFRLAEFTPQFREKDWCRKSHLGYVLEGEVEINFNGTPLRFKAGDGVFIPGGEDSKHKAHVESGRARFFFIENA